MKKLLALILVLTLCAALFTGCNTKAPNDDDSIIDESVVTSDSTDDTKDVDTENLDYSSFERGVVTDGVYSSDILKIKFTIPENWTVYDDEQIAQFMQISAELMEDENMKKALDTLPVVYDLFTIDMTTGNSVIVILEPFASNPILAMFDENSYLDALLKQLNNADGTTATPGERITVTLGDSEFVMQPISSDINGAKTYQCYLCQKDGLFMKSIIMTIADGTSAETILSYFE